MFNPVMNLPGTEERDFHWYDYLDDPKGEDLMRTKKCPHCRQKISCVKYTVKITGEENGLITFEGERRLQGQESDKDQHIRINCPNCGRLLKFNKFIDKKCFNAVLQGVGMYDSKKKWKVVKDFLKIGKEKKNG
jgi:hypothetical protein